MNEETAAAIAHVLRWHLESGVDECIGAVPRNRYEEEGTARRGEQAPRSVAAPPTALSTRPVPKSPAPLAARPIPPSAASGTAAMLAAAADTLDALKAALARYDGCALAKTATNLVFGDGSATARVVLIGEAPGAEEDRQGVPFVGVSGQLLDRMLASIGLDRAQVFISNTVFWRPPGNRAPTSQEVATCMPFVIRIIELIRPAMLVALGGPAANALLNRSESVSRLRGRWVTFESAGLDPPIPATALFHPAYLLRSPGQKRFAWRDLVAIKKRLSAG
ncbi:MAG: uracil-DNA glycosylase [Defluviicoccus sp.]|nr:uracil-DNA glycosylase [Defluviicoccus sp.]MDG4591244.1 uracil-DNA glycosylase [Defluviicoccus sp.]MDS4073540.1 uracil-DNA glycosylase [Defluviicoccus sp.]